MTNATSPSQSNSGSGSQERTAPVPSPPPPPMVQEAAPLEPVVQHPQPQYPVPTQGLINQGCTCYLNSLLQLLFHLGYFRSAVYRTTCQAVDDDAPIPQALQSLFFQMQERKTAPTTRGLTDAFGWDDRELYTQHDIQELAALLRDCLEKRMCGTPSEGAINRMFEGVGEQVVQTLDGSYASRTKDTFFDIHLPIQGFQNIIESLRSLTVMDQLVGDNKYKVEEEGKPAVYKDAEKGYRFVQFPPVIFFHMKRFEMDLMSPTLEMKKVNTMFEFSEELNLREFEDTSAAQGQQAPSATADDFDRSSQAVYDLTGVIVHRGTARSGHYYCYIRHYDAEQGRFTHWLEYDDDTVRVVDSDVAVEGNFGGLRSSTVNGRSHTFMSTNNAYILSYVRRADRGVVLAPSPTDIIPENVKIDLRRMMEMDEKRSKIEAIRRAQVRVIIATDESIGRCVQQNIVDLLPNSERTNPQFCKHVDVKKSDSFPSLYTSIAEALGKDKYPRDQIRLWKWTAAGPNKCIYRPTSPLKIFDESPPELTIAQGVLTQSMMERDAMATVILYVERLPPKYDPQTLTPLLSNPARAVRVFVKACVPRDRSMLFLGPLDLAKDATLASYMPRFAEMLGLDITTVANNKLAVAIEGNRLVDSRMLDLRQSIYSQNLVMGDILVLQYVPMSPAYRNASVVDLINEVRDTVRIQIREKVTPSNVLGELSALYSWDYDAVCDGIAKMLRQRNGGRAVSAENIQLFRNTDLSHPAPSEQPLRSNSTLTAYDMCSVGQYPSSYLFYQLLELPRASIESTQAINIRLFDREGLTVVKDVVISTTVPVQLAALVSEALRAPAVLPPAKKPAATSAAVADDKPGPSHDSVQEVTSPTTVQTPAEHYIAQFVFEGLHRSSRALVEVPLVNLSGSEPPALTRVLCPGEWIYLYPGSPPHVGGARQRKRWNDDTSSESDKGEETPASSSSSPNISQRGKLASPRPWIRVPVTQGEYLNSYASASFFGHPTFVDVDPDHTTIQEVLDAVTAHYGIDANNEEILQHPLMLVVDRDLAEADYLPSDRDVETFFYDSKHYRFTHLNEKIFPFLQSHGEKYLVYLNRKKPKEKPGSRYVATNDPKLVIEKRKPAS